MKTYKFIAVLVMGLSAMACTPKQEAAAENGDAAIDAAAAQESSKVLTAKDFKSSKAEIDSVSYLLGINFGSFLKSYNFGKDLNFSQVVKGMKDFQNSEGNMNDPEFVNQFKINPETMNDVFNAYLEKQHNLLVYKNKETEQKFLAENAKKEGVQVTESGLQYIIEEAGNDVKPGLTDTVWVHYSGKLIDGTVFDETAPDAEPISFVLNRVVAGWGEGLQLIGEGGKIKLFIPSELGYGESGNQAIEPNATLLFDVTLEKVGKYVAPVEEEESK